MATSEVVSKECIAPLVKHIQEKHRQKEEKANERKKKAVKLPPKKTDGIILLTKPCETINSKSKKTSKISKKSDIVQLKVEKGRKHSGRRRDAFDKNKVQRKEGNGINLSCFTDVN